MINTVIKECKELWSYKRIWIGILTVLIILIIGTSYNTKLIDDNRSSSSETDNLKELGSEQLKLGVINLDESSYSGLLLDYFNSSETFSSLLAVVEGDSNFIKTAFNRGEIDIYLEIPEDFAKNMVWLEHSPITVTINTIDTSKAILFTNVLKSYEKYISAVEANAVGLYEIMQENGMDQKVLLDTNRIVSLDLIFTALGKESFFFFEPMESFPVTTLIQYYLNSILIITLLYLGLGIGYQLLDERKQGTLVRLRTIRTPFYRYLLAKMIFFVVIITSLSISATVVLTKTSINLASLGFCLAISMFCIAQAIFLSALFPTTQSYMVAGNFLIFFFTILGGGIIPLQFLPQDMLVISKITPNYYILRGMLAIKQSNNMEAGETMLGVFVISVLLTGGALLLLVRRGVNYEEA